MIARVRAVSEKALANSESIPPEEVWEALAISAAPKGAAVAGAHRSQLESSGPESGSRVGRTGERSMPVGADGEFIDQVSAVRAWAQAAHEVLVATASRQRGAIDTATLARTVQQRTGIATKQSASKWIGPLLGVIAKHNADRGEPLLPALVVRRDGTVGPAWEEVLRFARIPIPDGDLEQHAAAQRMAAHHRWAGTVEEAPAASAVKAPRAAGVKRAAPTTAKRPVNPEPLRGSICPNCFMQMSLTGVCDNCD